MAIGEDPIAASSANHGACRHALVGVIGDGIASHLGLITEDPLADFDGKIVDSGHSHVASCIHPGLLDYELWNNAVVKELSAAHAAHIIPHILQPGSEGA